MVCSMCLFIDESEYGMVVSSMACVFPGLLGVLITTKYVI